MDKQKENNYEYLLGIFGEEKIKERYSFLYYLCEEFIHGYGLSDYYKTSKSIVQEIVTDYFADIARLKEFHEIEKAHPFKVAAYTSFWVLRRCPIQLYSEPKDGSMVVDNYATSVNQLFAAVLLVTLAYDYTYSPETDKEFLKFFKQIHYFMVYRYYTPQFFELILEAMYIKPPFNSVNHRN